MSPWVTYDNSRGLANRLRLHCLAHAYALGNRRRLVVDWKKTAACHATYHDLFCGGPGCRSSIGVIERCQLALAKRLSCTTLGAGTLPNGACVESIPNSRKKLVHFEQGIEATIEGCKRYGKYERAVCQSLVPVPEITAAVDRCISRIPSPRVGIHIRLGDFQAKYGHDLPPLVRYVDIAKAIRQRWPGVGILLVTDANDRTLTWLVEMLGTACRERTNCRTSVLGVREALTDMLALAAMDAVVSTPLSSFGAFAAMYGNRPLVRADADWRAHLREALDRQDRAQPVLVG